MPRPPTWPCWPPGPPNACSRYEDPLGKPLLLGNGAYRVVGVLDSRRTAAAPCRGRSARGPQQRHLHPAHRPQPLRRIADDRAVRRPDFERTQLSEITLTLRDETLVSATAAMVRKLLEQRHPQGNDFEIQVPLELLRQAEREKRIWNLVLGSIAGISLLVGGIGIMNIMLATVSERTQEIGIRGALGATAATSRPSSWSRPSVLSSTGGLLGIAVGIAIPPLVTRRRDRDGAELVVDPARLRHLRCHRDRVRNVSGSPRSHDESDRGVAARMMGRCLSISPQPTARHAAHHPAAPVPVSLGGDHRRVRPPGDRAARTRHRTASGLDGRRRGTPRTLGGKAGPATAATDGDHHHAIRLRRVLYGHWILGHSPA